MELSSNPTAVDFVFWLLNLFSFVAFGMLVCVVGNLHSGVCIKYSRLGGNLFDSGLSSIEGIFGAYARG